MDFKSAEEVSSICWQLRESDWPRAENRARINSLFNGAPPYTAQEVADNEIEINVNSLESTRIAHDARAQYAQAFQKSGNFFKLTTDMGPVHKRQKVSTIVTKAINRTMKRSLVYYESNRSDFASLVLHGPGITAWEDKACWCPDALGVEDLLVPANTFITFKNLPFFCILRSFTARELIKLTRGFRVDPAWNIPLVNQTLEYIDRETMALLGSNYAEIWSPEKTQERIKSDGGFYMGDQVPTVDVFDFYYWSDEGKDAGWRRRMLIDDWSTPSYGSGGGYSRNKKLDFAKNQWLFNPGNRKIADRREEIFSCQFADLSAVGPFRYHSVRSLGFMMYALCHLQNRMRCKFNESVMEALMMYFRVKSMEDVQRVLKTNLINKGFIDETLQFVPAAERFQVNAALVELGLGENNRLIQENSSSYTQNTKDQKGRAEKTATQIQAELASMTSLVSAGLQQSYQYKTFQYMEIVRRFMRRNSKDGEVKATRASILRQGVSEKYLNPEAWDTEPERVMSPNKSMEMAIAEWLMQHRDKYDPEPQREILRNVTLAVTDDPGLSDRLVPEQPQVSVTVYNTANSIGSLMAGVDVPIVSGLNELEVIPTLLHGLATIMQKVQELGGSPSKEEIVGLANVSKHIKQHIAVMAQDEANKAIVKQFNDGLKNIDNIIKGYAQRLAQQQQSQNGNGMDAETQAKIRAMMVTAQAKAENTKTAHAQKTAQRQISFEMKLKQDEEQHRLDMAKEAQKLQLEHVKTIADIHTNRLKSLASDTGEE